MQACEFPRAPLLFARKKIGFDSCVLSNAMTMTMTMTMTTTTKIYRSTWPVMKLSYRANSTFLGRVRPSSQPWMIRKRYPQHEHDDHPRPFHDIFTFHSPVRGALAAVIVHHLLYLQRRLQHLFASQTAEATLVRAVIARL